MVEQVTADWLSPGISRCNGKSKSCSDHRFALSSKQFTITEYKLYARYTVALYISHLIYTTPYVIRIVVAGGETELSECESFAQGHRANKWQKQSLNPGAVFFKAQRVTTLLGDVAKSDGPSAKDLEGYRDHYQTGTCCL